MDLHAPFGRIPGRRRYLAQSFARGNKLLTTPADESGCGDLLPHFEESLLLPDT